VKCACRECLFHLWPDATVTPSSTHQKQSILTCMRAGRSASVQLGLCSMNLAAKRLDIGKNGYILLSSFSFEVCMKFIFCSSMLSDRGS